MRHVKIGNKKVGAGFPVFIIAEAGVNHNGSIKLAKKMIDLAKSIGADAIKFQTFRTENLVAFSAPKANYQKETTAKKTHFQMLKELELSEADFEKLYSYCKKKKIIFLSTPFDSQSAEFLDKLGVCAFKISSGDLTNMSLLFQVAQYKKPIILSTGMSDLTEIKDAVDSIYAARNKELILLHCTSNYPTKYEDVNLKAMLTLNKTFGVPVGYSDHTCGIEISIAAVAIGASVIEKHFTLDRKFYGPDHKSSLEPAEFKKVIESVRRIERAMGDGFKRPQRSEIEIKNVVRKSIVAACDISKGRRLTLDMLAVKRPGTGIEPKYLNQLINRQIKINLKKDQILNWGMVRT